VLQVFEGLVNTVVSQSIKAQEKPNFIMKTLTATMGVRGTEWYALMKSNNTEIFLTSGRLSVRNINSLVPGEIFLNPMKRTQVRPNQTPENPQHFEMQDIVPLQKRLGNEGDSSGGGGNSGTGGPSGSGYTRPMDPFASGLVASPTAGGLLTSSFSYSPSAGSTPSSPTESGIKQWTGGSGSWDDAGVAAGTNNWTSPGAPTSGNSACLTQNDATDRTVEYNSATPKQLNELQVDATGTGNMTLRQDSDSSLAANNEYVGNQGRGSYIQTASSNTISNDLSLGNGSGQLQAQNL
jgi:hypothetical protein